MLRLSRLADYAVVILLQLARQDEVQTAQGISRRTGVPEPTVAKLLKRLNAAGIVRSQRGAHGGYRLLPSPDRIAVGDVIAAVDGPISLTPCADGALGRCEVENVCAVQGRWHAVNDAVRQTLRNVSLADLDRTPRRSPATAAPRPSPLREPALTEPNVTQPGPTA